MTETTTLPCARGCTIGGRHLDDCPGEDCRGCQPRPATDGARLCRGCTARLRGMLTGPNSAVVADRRLADELGQHLSAVRYDGDGHGSADPLAPLDVARFDARRELHDVLADWVDALRAWRGLAGPDDRDPAGLARYLLGWLDELLTWETIGEWWGRLAWCLSQAHALAPWRAEMRRCHGVPCPDCGKAELVVYSGEAYVTCRACGCLTHRDVYVQHVERVARDAREGADGHTLAEIAQALGLKPWTVRSWAQRGRLTPIGSRGNAATYSLAEARRLAG